MKTKSTNPTTPRMGRREIIATVWITAVLAVLFPVTALLNGSFPIFTLILLIVPLSVLFQWRNADVIGFRTVAWRDFLKYTGINLAGSLALMAVFEPWSHTYKMLFTEAISSGTVDTTFGWLLRFPGAAGWVGFVLFAGLVTLFAEELFFRGWLLQSLLRRMGSWQAILLQATLFTLPQLLAAIILPTMQGILYGVVYSWLAIGFIGGWTAHRTRSFLPSLTSALIYNVIMVLFSMQG